MEVVKLNVLGNRQNIDLPETLFFSDDDLCATRIGDAVIIMPRKSVRAIMREGFNHFTSDFFAEGRTPQQSKAAVEIEG